jgi:phosphoglycerate-specific signal transduction histidine kinase
VEAAIKFNDAQQSIENITELQKINITNLTEVITGLTIKDYKLTTLPTPTIKNINTTPTDYTLIDEVSSKNKEIEKQFKLIRDTVSPKLTAIRNDLYVLWTIVKLDTRNQEENKQKKTDLLTKYKKLSDLIESVDDHFKLIGELIQKVNDNVSFITSGDATDKMNYNYLETAAIYANDKTPQILSLDVNETMKTIVDEYNKTMKQYLSYYKPLLSGYIDGLNTFNKNYKQIANHIINNY